MPNTKAFDQAENQTTKILKHFKTIFEGSDLAGETAAAMAAAAIVFEPTSPAYAEKLLAHAKELYEFAITDKGIYSTSITAAREAYQ